MDGDTESLPVAAPRTRRRGRWWRWLAILVLGVVALAGGALLLLDTAPGHRFIVRQIAAIETPTGLRFHVGRIDGSIYSSARLRDLRVSDPEGLVFSVPDLRLDWRPFAWLDNRLSIDRAVAARATLHKAPRLRRTGRQAPILPGFDIRIGELRIDRLTVAPAISGNGVSRVGRLRARADVRSGRALVDLDLAVAGSDDVSLRLDAEPDGDRFELAARVRGAADGLVSRLSGLNRAIALDIAGHGAWTRWDGTAGLIIGRTRAADLRLAVDAGRYSLAGALAPGDLVRGKLMRLTSPRVIVSGAATLADRRLDGTLSLRSAALAVTTEGIVDLGSGAFDNLRTRARLLRPPALFPNMTGRDVRLDLLLDGGFGTARFDYRLTAPQFAFDRTGFLNASAVGRGRLSRAPVLVPVRFRAAAVTGVGDVAGGILRNLTVDGVLRVTAKAVTGDDLRLRSDKLTSRINLFLDLATGRYDIGINGQLGRYLIPGVGIVDVQTRLRVVPGAGGRGTRVIGRGTAIVRRFDNAFLRSLAGGLPRIDTDLERGPDGILYLRNTRINAPALTATGNGLRRRDGTFYFQGQGRQAQYGPFRLTLDGRIDRPKLDILLSSPLPALGLRDVRVLLDPTASGFAYRAQGGSTLGPFTSTGAILLPRGGTSRIAIADLRVSGIAAQGNLAIVPGGFDGAVALQGGGVAGTLTFAPRGEDQAITAALTLEGARLGGAANLTVRRGTANGTIVLDPDGQTITAKVQAQGVRRGGLRLSRLSAEADLRGGRGTVRATLQGSRQQRFELQLAADIAPDRVRLQGSGELEDRVIALARPAVITREGGGWRLAPAAVTYAGGQVTLAGLFGGAATELTAQLQRLPLSLLDISSEGLGLGGTASGQLTYRQSQEGAPTGSVNLTVRGLSRSGLVLTSQPVDLGVAAVLTPDRAGIRAVVASGGRTIGRAQARLAPLAEGPLATRLLNAPLNAQLRYNGPAATLWRLTGVEIFDLTGDVAVGADATGRLADPAIRGSLATSNLRLESAVTGTVLTGMTARGRFGGSRLVVDEFTARAGPGSVSGRASFDLAATRGFGIDIAVQADNAELLRLDSLGATVTGPLRIRSDGSGGLISGDVTMNRSRFTLGRATASTVLPKVRLREINRRGEEIEQEAAPDPWRLALKARAPNRLEVTGLGLSSEWSADLDIAGTVTAPEIRGRADLVRGEYEFAGRDFDLERGAIRFTGSVPADPVLDIAAIANTQGLNATIRVTGTGQRPEIGFTSMPALPEDELLSRLLFGTSITNLSAPEALQLAAAVASLQGGGNGLNPINAVRDAAGLDRLRILAADPTRGQGTAVAAGKYITRNTFVEIITDGAGYSATQVEFQITRWLSLLGSISTLGRQSVNARVSKDY